MILVPTAHVLPTPAAEALQRAHARMQDMNTQERVLFLDEVIKRVRQQYPERFRQPGDEVKA